MFVFSSRASLKLRRRSNWEMPSVLVFDFFFIRPTDTATLQFHQPCAYQNIEDKPAIWGINLRGSHTQICVHLTESLLDGVIPIRQWTKDSLDAAKLLVETWQQNDISSEIGMGQCQEAGLSQALVIEQLQLDLDKMKNL